MKKEIIALGVISGAGVAGAAVTANLYAAETEVEQLPADSDTVSELTSSDYYLEPEDVPDKETQTEKGTAGKDTTETDSGNDEQTSDQGSSDDTGQEETGSPIDDAESLTPDNTVENQFRAAAEAVTYTTAVPQASQQLTGKGVENAAVNQTQLSQDYVLVHATTGETGQDKYLKDNAKTVLDAKKLLGIYHNGGNGSAAKEAENFYLSSRDYVGKAVFILNANGSLGNGGTTWVRDFLDWFHQFSGVKAVCYDSGHAVQSYDWNQVKPAYEVWSDKAAVNNTGFNGTVSNSTYAGTAGDWNQMQKPDKKQEYSVDMYRLYNVFSSEHLYTASPLEKDVLSKSGAWNYEGVAWRNPLSGGSDVYRLYNRYSGEHHYTTSTLERDSLRKVGWNYEGIGWLTDPAKGTAVYRLYNPYLPSGYHLFTTSSLEYNALTRMGWRQEGIAWYASKYFSTVKDSHYLAGEYAYDERGRQSTGIQKVGNEFYYANPDNGSKVEKREGLYKVTGGTVYVTGSGKLLKGQKQIGQNWKWFRPENALMAVNSFIDIPAGYNSGVTKTCYYDANGNMVKGSRNFGKATLTFDGNTGALVKASINGVQYLSQRDPRWGYSIVGFANMINSGCVPTVISMIVNTLKNGNTDPYTLALNLHSAGYMNTTITGSTAGAHFYAGQKYAIQVKALKTQDEIYSFLIRGGMIAAAMNPGIFTVIGFTHEILVYNYDNGYVNVMDPYNSGNNGRYLLNTIFNQRSTDPVDIYQGTPFFGYSV